MEEEIAEAAAQRGVIFLPFLQMKRGYRVAGVEFLPLRDDDGKIPPVLESAVAPVEKILSGYVNRKGHPLTNCVVATKPGKGWNLTPDDFADVVWASSLLFLAAWSCNRYLQKFGGPYVNSSNFRIVGQMFGGTMPHHISVSSRRRDGSTLDGGYKHGEFKFNVPLQVSVREFTAVDEALLAALDASNGAQAVVDLLRTAMPFVELANTDDDFMTPHAEAILMGSALEQLLRGDGSKYTLAANFGGVFEECGSVTVAEAQKTRPEISIDTSTPERAAAQPKWWVHRKWMEELYDLRSKVVHQGTHDTRQWGWTMFEHLLMAAHVFPLTAKLLLLREGHYQLTDADRVACRAVDKLLASPNWFNPDDGTESEESWSRIVSKTSSELTVEKAVKRLKALRAERESRSKT